MLKKVARKLGIDRAIFYTSAAKIVGAVGGIVSVILIATCLSGVEQGFYYTFASILAIQLFFELGLTGIIMQFVAHEKAHLEECTDELSGPEKHRSRLSYLLHFCLKWYTTIAVFLFVGLSVVGFVFFNTYYHSDQAVSWQMPWLLLCFATSMNFIVSPFSSFVEGLGKVQEVAKIRLIQSIAANSLVWVVLLLGGGLYAAVAMPFSVFIVFGIMIWRKYGRLLVNIFRIPITDRVSYRQEIFPYQWRIAISWISGYFVFQLFNPILFATQSAVVAGQMGMTLSVLNNIRALSMSWINTKVPSFSSMIALKDISNLDATFDRTMKQALFVCLLMLVVFVFMVWGLDVLQIQWNGSLLYERMLPLVPLIFMSLAVFIDGFVACFAVYMRCHKTEPMMIQSVVMAVLCGGSIFVTAKYFGLDVMTFTYMVITTIGCLWAYLIFRNFKTRWHS